MFVFPAFNKGYKKRRRTFICCSQCRAKKIKCKVTDEFEKVGCLGCSKANLACGLIVSTDGSSTDGGTNTSIKVAENGSRNSLNGTDELNDEYYKPNYEKSINNGMDVMAESNNALPTMTSISDMVQSNTKSTSSNIDFEARQDRLDPPVIEKLNNMPEFSHRHVLLPKVLNSGVARGTYLKMKYNYNVLSELEHYLFPTSSCQKHIKGDDTLMSGYSLKYFESICGFYYSYSTFSKEDMKDLFQIYFEKYNSIFPIIHEQSFWKDFQNDANPTIILHTLIYFITKDTLSIPFTKKYFGEANTDEEVAKFRDKMSTQVRHLLVHMPILNPSTKMIVYLLLCLDNSGNKDVDYKRTAKDDFTLAVNNAIALDLHLNNDNLNTEVATYQCNLIWTIYILGLFNVISIGDYKRLKFLPLRFSDIERKTPMDDSIRFLLDVIRPIEQLITNKFPENEMNFFKHGEYLACAKYLCPNPISDAYVSPLTEQYNNTMTGLINRVVNYSVIMIYNDSLDTPDEVFPVSYSKAILTYFEKFGQERIPQIPLFMEAMAIAIKKLKTVALHVDDITEFETQISPYCKYWNVLQSVEKEIKALKIM